MNDEKEVAKATQAILKMRGELSALDLSRIDHYAKCQERGRVPVRHYSGGWYNSTSEINIILLYLRLPERCRSSCVKPRGLRQHITRLHKEKITVH